MSVAEIEIAVTKLPLNEKRFLAQWLIEQLEDQADKELALQTLSERGASIAWNQLRKEV